MSETTELHRPSWATSHEETGAAINWERIEQVEIQPRSTEPGAHAVEVHVGAMLADTISVEDGRVALTRGEVAMFVGEGDDLMTVAEARTLAETILAMVNAVEGPAS